MNREEIDAVRAGLLGDALDRWFWRDKAERRVRALDEDEPLFGLVPAEVAERAELQAMLTPTGDARDGEVGRG